LENIKFGYACLNMTLGKQGGFRSMIKRTFEANGKKMAGDLAIENIQRLCGILEWNEKVGIQVYRMSSDMIPWASEYHLQELPQWNELRSLLEQAGDIARRSNQRVSFHPGQFNCLSSLRESVILNSIKDLRIHGEIMDIMGFPRTPYSAINIHLGGAFGERESAMERWCVAFERLPDSVKTRLTVENDDKASLFSVDDLFKGIHSKTGVPIVFDCHHWEVGPQERDLPYEQAIKTAASTWPSGIRPLCHHSSSAKIFEGKNVGLNAHADYIYSKFNSCGLEVDVEIEAKAKELAVMKYVSLWAEKHKEDGLQVLPLKSAV
jgi:UV DNA damage endonuclease